jgi:SAM-dependent methyltransferase
MKFGRVIGVDVSESMIAKAREDNPTQEYFATDGVSLAPIASSSIDFTFSFSSLNHIVRKKYLAGMFEEIHRVLKPGGSARINVRGYPGKAFGAIRWWKSFDRGYITLTRVRGITIPFFRLFDAQYGVCVNEAQLLAMTGRFASAKPWRSEPRHDLWIDLVK